MAYDEKLCDERHLRIDTKLEEQGKKLDQIIILLITTLISIIVTLINLNVVNQ